MPIFNPPICPPSGFQHAYPNSTGNVTINTGIATMPSGSTPYNQTVSTSPTFTGGSSVYLEMSSIIVIGQITGTASSVGDTVTLIVNGDTVYSQSISPSFDWTATVDQIFLSATATIQLIVEPSDDVTTDGTINLASITVYPGAINWGSDNLFTGEAFGISILGNAAITPILNNYDWYYSTAIDSAGIVPTSAWNNTDQYNMEVSFANGPITLLIQAVTSGSTNLYPTLINVGYVLGA